MTPYFAQPKPEDGKFLAFARDICLGQLLATVIVLPEWLGPNVVEVMQEEDMEAVLERLAPGHPRIETETPRTERVLVTQASLSPLSLFHLMMVFPLLSPSTAWYMMHAKADAMGTIQRVTPFMEWMRVETVEPQQVIADLTGVDLSNTMLEQR